MEPNNYIIDKDYELDRDHIERFRQWLYDRVCQIGFVYGADLKSDWIHRNNLLRISSQLTFSWGLGYTIYISEKNDRSLLYMPNDFMYTMFGPRSGYVFPHYVVCENVIKTVERELRFALPRMKRSCYLGLCSASYYNGCNSAVTVLNEGGSICEECKPLMMEHGDGENPDKEGYIYLVGNDQFGIYKIGYSKDPTKRLSDIRANAPFSIEMIHTIETENVRRDEKIAHRIFRKKRLKKRGEWFHLNKGDIERFKSVDFNEHQFERHV